MDRQTQRKMTLRQKQGHFTQMIGSLTQYASRHGYRVVMYAIGRKYLSMDLLFYREEQFIWDQKDLEPIALYWEAIGGTRGGRRRDLFRNRFTLADTK